MWTRSGLFVQLAPPLLSVSHLAIMQQLRMSSFGLARASLRRYTGMRNLAILSDVSWTHSQWDTPQLVQVGEFGFSSRQNRNVAVCVSPKIQEILIGSFRFRRVSCQSERPA